MFILQRINEIKPKIIKKKEKEFEAMVMFKDDVDNDTENINTDL